MREGREKPRGTNAKREVSFVGEKGESPPLPPGREEADWRISYHRRGENIVNVGGQLSLKWR